MQEWAPPSDGVKNFRKTDTSEGVANLVPLITLALSISGASIRKTRLQRRADGGTRVITQASSISYSSCDQATNHIDFLLGQ